MSLIDQVLDVLSNPGVIAIGTAAITTVGVKYVENRNKGSILKVDESTALRVELRAEISALRKQIADKEIDLAKWREEFYKLQDKYNEAMNNLRIANADLEEAREEIKNLQPPNGVH
jgi:chromosome segregation ATPase